ncbi:hypothetical protein TARUN_9717 [Trichoderma arundinaceum]|uniref:Uncharacterized protein n=1 Tax=Trichoderma arundinaceum TaxID=490622 RepID=A0A395N8S9_TRIAR|nr:hypothetical protein TARUN_9717 [Trichoderma arundinaceum]
MNLTTAAGVRPYTLFISWIEKPFNPFSPHPSGFLEVLILGPIVPQDHEDELLHVNEANPLEYLLEGGAQDSRALKALRTDSHLVEPCAHWPARVQGAVIAAEDGFNFLGFESAAGLEGAKGLLASKACWAISFSKLHRLPAVSRVCMQPNSSV